MADLNIDQITEEWIKLKTLFESGAGIDALKQKFNDFGIDLAKFKSVLPDLNQNIKNVGGTIKDITSTNLSSNLDVWSNSFKKLKESIFETDEELAVSAGKLLMLSGIATRHLPLPEAFKSIGDAAAGANTQISQMLETTLKLVGADLSSKGKGIAGLLSANAERADFAKNFETGFLMAATASGEFSKSIKNIGEDFSGLSQKTESYSHLVTAVGDASGLSSAKVGEYAAMLRKIPGALDNFGGKSDKTVKDMHYLDAAIKVSMGTGQSFETVIQDLAFSFDNFGTVGKTALEEVARMQRVSDAVGLPMSQMRQYTQASAKEFKLLGDNTQGAIDIMARFGPAFRESGMGPAAIQEVVQGITQGIGKMGTAQKAFLSAQSGGSGGLQGAFQIDLALQQGKLGEVYKKIEDNLKKQFGGNVVTLEQAAGNAQAAGQYQKQIQFLRSPAMGGIAQDQQSAMRILEAFSKGKGGELNKTLTPEKALGDSLKVGEKLQERQGSLLVEINNWAERQAQIQSIIAYNTSRLAGNEGPLSGYLKDLSGTSSKEAKNIQPVIGQGLQGGQNVDNVIKQSYTGAVDKLDDLKDHVKKLFNNFGEELQPKENILGPPLLLSRKVPSATEYAQQSVQNTEKIAAKDMNKTATHTKEARTDIAITTVCSQCQKKIAHETAQEVVNKQLNHYHKQGQINNYHPGQTLEK